MNVGLGKGRVWAIRIPVCGKRPWLLKKAESFPRLLARRVELGNRQVFETYVPN
jgi:hypothetical protein